LIAYYERNAKVVTAKYEAANMSQFHAWLLEVCPRDCSVLELGCGSGREAAFLQSKGYGIVATDGSMAILLEAIRLHPELRGRILLLPVPASFPFRDESFDSILAVGLLMHLVEFDIQTTLKEIARVLTAAGRLIFSLPLARDDVDIGGRDALGRYYNSLDESRWGELLIDAGFRLSERNETRDSLGRTGIRWATYLAKKRV
jgi:SAM-dependent methyltransferase